MSDRQKKLDAAMKHIDKKWSDTKAQRASVADQNRVYRPTGSLSLDFILGGGWVAGRMYELYGNEDAGKTTLALSSIIEAQKMDLTVAYIDAEHRLDYKYMADLGIDMETLGVIEPECAEAALDSVRTFVDSGFDLIVVDTVASMVPAAEKSGEIGDAHVGRLARLMSQAMRILDSEVKTSGCVVIFINQIREKIGVRFGSPETTPGGRALKYHASGRLVVRRGDRIKASSSDDAEVLGRWAKVTVQKNKTSAPDRKIEFPLIYGVGIDRKYEIMTLAVKFGLMTKKGSWITYRKLKFQGINGFREKCKKHEKLLETVENEVKEALLNG